MAPGGDTPSETRSSRKTICLTGFFPPRWKHRHTPGDTSTEQDPSRSFTSLLGLFPLDRFLCRCLLKSRFARRFDSRRDSNPHLRKEAAASARRERNQQTQQRSKKPGLLLCGTPVHCWCWALMDYMDSGTRYTPNKVRHLLTRYISYNLPKLYIHNLLKLNIYIIYLPETKNISMYPPETIHILLKLNIYIIYLPETKHIYLYILLKLYISC